MMTCKATIYKKILDDAHEYLLSFNEIDENMVEKHLNAWKTREPKTVQDLLLAMLGAISNRQGMPNAIGDIEKLRPYLKDFTPKQIIEEYNSDWEALFKIIKKNYEPPGRMVIDNPKNYWVIFCKSIISASHFLSQFSKVKEFNDFVSRFYLNEYTRVALPLLLEKEIFGLGFALACDFLKDNGYPKFIKPDVHIKTIFHDIGISKSTSDYDIFKDVIRFSEEIDELPYRVDKLFWLVGSGYFYLDSKRIRIKTDRGRFIMKIKDKYGNML